MIVVTVRWPGSLLNTVEREVTLEQSRAVIALLDSFAEPREPVRKCAYCKREHRWDMLHSLSGTDDGSGRMLEVCETCLERGREAEDRPYDGGEDDRYPA